jgi:hypothetical protein
MASPKDNRRLTIMLAIGGVAIALFAAYSLFSGGGGGSDGAISPPSTQAADSGDAHGGDQATPTTTAPGTPTIPSGDFDAAAVRNPFEPAIDVTFEDTTADTTPTDGTSVDTTPTAGTSVDTTPASQDPSAGTTVAVIDVFDQAGTTVAVVQVGSTQYTVAAGQVFATNYKVVSINGACGQFLYGDSPFSLCKGEQALK